METKKMFDGTKDHPLYEDGTTVKETVDILTMKGNWDAVYKGERGINVKDLPYSLNAIPTEILTRFGTAEIAGGNCQVLDEACGDGHMTKWMEDNLKIDQKYFLHDVSTEALKYAQKTFGFKDEQLILSPDLKDDDKTFDKILVWGLYHHLSPDLWQDYSKMYREKLNGDGIICIASWTLDDPVWKKTREQNPSRRKETLSQLATGPVDFNKIIHPYFDIKREGFMDIKEGTTGNIRKLKVVLARKNKL